MNNISPELKERLSALNELSRQIEEAEQDIKNEQEILAKAKRMHYDDKYSDDPVEIVNHAKFEQELEEKIVVFKERLKELQRKKDGMGDFFPR